MRVLAYIGMVLFFVWIARFRLKYPWIMVIFGIGAFTAYVLLRPPGEWMLVQVPVVD